VPDFTRLAIVNRGEPALRLLHAVAELNAERSDRITTIALYTDPDADAWFVREADEAVHLGPATSLDPTEGRRVHTYLDHDLLIARLTAARAEAVWCGWGFVSEHADFAERCEQAGIVFIGPDSATIRKLGDKIASKHLAEEAGVPVVPWNGGALADVADALAAGEDLGYPVVLKATAGGGGRGIRVVEGPAEMETAFAAASAEAAHAFGNPTLFCEQLVRGGHHIEVQIIADTHGTTWAAGVRDCSVQRRKQKVIEESAAASLRPTSRRRSPPPACACARQPATATPAPSSSCATRPTGATCSWRSTPASRSSTP
jgi:acetyl/propionyl-CoA carboxylase alpha subunit